MNKSYIICKIKAVPGKIEELFSFHNRCKVGHSDLVKGHPQSAPITTEQAKHIMDFWNPYVMTWKGKKAFDIRWFDIYNRTNVFGFDLTHYIPDSYYYTVVDKCLTNTHNAPIMDDKNLYDLYFHDVVQPLTIFRKMNGLILDKNYQPITMEKAIQYCVEQGAVILKPSVEAVAGSGIFFWRNDQNSIDELKTAIKSNSNLVVQQLIKQHPFLAQFTDSCVNTMRIITLLWEGAVVVTSSVLIMGGPSSKTNHLHGGGIVCGILPDGRLRHTAFDGHLNAYKEHPNGICFADVQIPNYDKCLALVKRLAPRMAGVSKLLNWDLTLDENGEPLLIEVNLTWGGSVQIAAGPAFGELTKDVLDYVKQNGRWKV